MAERLPGENWDPVAFLKVIPPCAGIDLSFTMITGFAIRYPRVRGDSPVYGHHNPDSMKFTPFALPVRVGISPIVRVWTRRLSSSPVYAGIVRDRSERVYPVSRFPSIRGDKPARQSERRA
jgi:hypothetical protein